jgi:uncharacterized protein YwqG
MFPESLQPYQQIIESTAMPTVLLSFKEEKTALYQSKIGGIPYFPGDYPVDFFYVPYPNTVKYTPWPKHPETGRELPLLIQINFEEMPPLPSFPRTGILQLFIDERYWDDLEINLRVIYHPDVIREEELLFSDFNHSLDEYRVQERSISFHKETEYITPSDFRFNQVLPNDVISDRIWKDYLSITDHRFRSQDKDPGYGRNKIGGYHYSQNNQDPRASPPRWYDPRASDPEWQDSLLLVQFQDYERLSWGDGGSAQFFIKRKDLEELNFQDLLFHWDST